MVLQIVYIYRKHIEGSYYSLHCDIRKTLLVLKYICHLVDSWKSIEKQESQGKHQRPSWE